MVDDRWLGAQLAGYRLDALVGRGGTGVVYRATHLRLGRPAAVKLLDGGSAEDVEFRRRFEREARLAAGLEHSHIVPIYDAGHVRDVLYLAMRYVDGPNLATVIANDAPMDRRRVCALLTGVAEALDAAHRAGLVHRDVKPANVLIAAGDRHAYLCDFGIARQASSSSALTSAGQFLGTLRYCAPEQIQGQPLDGRADQYALACVVFHALTGQPPFPAEEPAAIIFAHLSAAPPRPSGRLPALPAAVDDVLARALAKQPTDRYPDCASFLHALAVASGAATSSGITTSGVATASGPATSTGIAGVGARSSPERAPRAPVTPHTLVWPPGAKPADSERPTQPTTAPDGSGGGGIRRALVLPGLPLLGLLLVGVLLFWVLPLHTDQHPPAPPSPAAPTAATAQPRPSPTPPPGLPIGDPRLVDECALLNPAQFAGFGRVSGGPVITGNFNSCVMEVALHSGGKVLVNLAVVKTTAAFQGNIEQQGALGIVRPQPPANNCRRNILLSDTTNVVITAQLTGGPADVCAITDLATQGAVRVLTERGVPHVASLGDANSLRQVNACALLDDQVLRQVPTLDPTRRYESFAGWACTWGNNPYARGFQPPSVDVFFEWVRPLVPANGTRVQLAGRDVYVKNGTNSSGQAACYARIVHRDRPLGDGEKAQELVVLAVYAAIPPADQCQLARGLATAVISKLPPP